VAEPRITGQPQAQTVTEGERAEFTVTAEGEGLTFEWTEAGKPGKGTKTGSGTTSTYTIDSASRDQDGLEIRAIAKDKDGKTATSDPAKLTVRAKEETVLWVPSFAKTSAQVVCAAAAVVLLPLVIALYDILEGPTGDTGFAAAIAAELVAVGVLVVAGGVYLALLEFRGRARTIKEISDLRAAQEGEALEGISVPDLVKALPETLKAFGQLRAMTALLATAAVLFISATVIAFQLADKPEPATPTTDTSPATEEPTDSTPRDP
jgi:hypothetical protein